MTCGVFFRRTVGISVLALTVTIAQGGHELPIYPSFYPHEIEIRTIAPENAAEKLQQGKLQAYIGPGLSFTRNLPPDVQAIETLGSYVALHANPGSARVKAAPCAALAAVARDLSRRADGFVLHPYPVTPFHGDYLHHADLAQAAKARVLESDFPVGNLSIRGNGELAKVYPPTGDDIDVEIYEIDVAQLIATRMLQLNGLIAPPWLKDGWWHALLVPGDNVSDNQVQEIENNQRRLMNGDVAGLADRINVERDLVRTLASGCRSLIAGYTRKREYVNVEFSAGIENIGYDSLSGLASPMFIRTVKLKDFPWNGWLMLGMRAPSTSAWNPVGGMTDPFGQQLLFAVGDPALIRAPYDAGWMLNRIADLPTSGAEP
jgi:hypothetical protein